ncbi:hypothetical protein RCL1_001178 [Eukaryota sp. TZLM3-RCL]
MQGPQRKDIIDMSKFINRPVHIRLSGGRTVTGIVKGYDALLNTVLDNMIELLHDPENPSILSGESRSLGIGVVKGATIASIFPTDIPSK